MNALHIGNNVITPEGRVVPAPEPDGGEGYSLLQLQEMVGGFIEIINVADRNTSRIMVINEEGKMRGMPPNGLATYLAGEAIFGSDHLVGTVLYCDSDLVQ